MKTLQNGQLDTTSSQQGWQALTRLVLEACMADGAEILAAVARALGQRFQSDDRERGLWSRLLFELMEDSSAACRVLVAAAIGHGVRPPVAPSLLEQALVDPHPLVRASAAEACGKIGIDPNEPGWRPVTDRLVRAFSEDQSEMVQACAAFSLARVLGVASIPVLRSGLRTASEDLRLEIEGALAEAAKRRTDGNRDEVSLPVWSTPEHACS